MEPRTLNLKSSDYLPTLSSIPGVLMHQASELCNLPQRSPNASAARCDRSSRPSLRDIAWAILHGGEHWTEWDDACTALPATANERVFRGSRDYDQK